MLDGSWRNFWMNPNTEKIIIGKIFKGFSLKLKSLKK